MSTRARMFALLFGAGFVGVLSTLLIDVSSLLRTLPVTSNQPLTLPLPILKILGLIQPTILVGIAVLVGLSLARSVGLSAPVFEALARNENWTRPFRPQLLPGAIGGIIGGVVILLSWVLWRPFLPAEFVVRAEDFNRLIPVLTRLLYGGITEEVLIRWGLLTLLVWAFWKVLHKEKEGPRTTAFVTAIVVSSLVFGVGHLPLAIAIGSRLTFAVVTYIVFANSAFGFIAGYLYWQKGLESAIVAHMLAHAVIVSGLLIYG